MKQENSSDSKNFQTQVMGGIANIGTNHIYNYPTDKPINPANRIPHQGTSHFVGRHNELALIHEKFHQQQNTVVISALGGMGGIGKTELAVKYARTHLDDYPGGVCWFNARSGNIATEILTFAKNDLQLEVPQKDFQEQPLTLKQQIEWCWRNWRPPNGLVLVVFDDVTDLENFADYLPKNNRFRVLITTRLRNLDANIEEISLDVLSPDEALELFKKLAGEKKVNKELETAKELCKWLGYLPLGIELVGRYIAKKPPHFTSAKMLEQLKQQRLEQEAVNPKQKTLSTAQLGVLAAFEISWKELSQVTQRVALLLSLFAADIFALEWLYSITESLNWDESEVETAIDELYQRHLMQYVESGESDYKIHPLIREFFQMKLTASASINELKQAFTKTFMGIAETIPDSPTLEFINSVKKAIPHLTEIAENLIDVVSNKHLIWAFAGLERFYCGQGLYNLAEVWCKQRLSAIQSRLSDIHPEFATSLGNLAEVYRLQGKYDEAEPLGIQALKLFKRILGENHPTLLSNLALLYYEQGRYSEAEPLFIQAFELTRRIFGENHPDFAKSLNYLAVLYFSQGRYDKAEPLYIQASELTKRMLGENHPHFAVSLSNLAGFYESQGKYDKVEALYIQALELNKHILGENHPNYASSLNNLAGLYYFQGKYDRAEQFYIQALELNKRILGENHPNYAFNLNNLAALYNDQGKYSKAEPFYIQAFELNKRILGENHPDYAISLNGLATFYSAQGKYNKAEPLFIEALELRKRILGKNHPDYASSLNNLAGLYDSFCWYDKAEPLFIEALELRERILGKNHPDYASSLNNLAGLYRSQGKYNEAKPLYIQALELFKRILAENHPNVATSLNNLALLYYFQGKYDEAESLYIQALEIYEKRLGINHPDTKNCRQNLKILRSTMNS